MAPPFVPEDEELLIAIRNTIRNHRKGTWENTTKLYNILVPSRVQRTQDSLQNRYKIMNVEQAQRRAQGNSKSALEDKVLRTFHKMLNVSMYATEYPDLAIRKSSGIRARTQTAGGRSKNGRDGRNTSIRSAEPHQTRSKGQSSSKDSHINYRPSVRMSIVSQTFSRPSGSANLPNFEVDNFACLTSEIRLRLDILEQGLRR